MTSPDDHATDATTRAMLEQALLNLGSSPEQARVMAAQLLKRAGQIASERGVSPTLAMAELLAKVVAGRKGEYTGTPPAPAGP